MGVVRSKSNKSSMRSSSKASGRYDYRINFTYSKIFLLNVFLFVLLSKQNSTKKTADGNSPSNMSRSASKMSTIKEGLKSTINPRSPSSYGNLVNLHF